MSVRKLLILATANVRLHDQEWYLGISATFTSNQLLTPWHFRNTEILTPVRYEAVRLETEIRW
jgi:hypothetical protein